jgi:hypothetical protein
MKADVPPTKPTRAERKRAAAIRQKRWRIRRKAGDVIFPVRGNASILDMLIRTRWLLESDAADPVKVGEAIHALLARSAKDFP